MRALVQRVKRASVVVEEEVVGSIGKGLLVFVGVHRDDQEDKIPWMVKKTGVTIVVLKLNVHPPRPGIKLL